MKLTSRQEIIIWLSNGHLSKKLRRFGTIIYVSFKMKYVIMYVDFNQIEDKLSQINQLPFVKHVELSPHQELQVEYSDDNSDVKVKKSKEDEECE